MPDETQEHSEQPTTESPSEGAAPEPAEQPAGETGSDEPEQPAEG